MCDVGREMLVRLRTPTDIPLGSTINKSNSFITIERMKIIIDRCLGFSSIRFNFCPDTHHHALGYVVTINSYQHGFILLSIKSFRLMKLIKKKSEMKRLSYEVSHR